MPYISTRGEAPRLGFSDALLAGLARDGGLYVPEAMPKITPAAIGALAGLPYAEAATRVVLPFTDGALTGIRTSLPSTMCWKRSLSSRVTIDG